MTKAQTFWQYLGKFDKWQQKAQIKRPASSFIVENTWNSMFILPQ